MSDLFIKLEDSHNSNNYKYYQREIINSVSKLTYLMNESDKESLNTFTYQSST